MTNGCRDDNQILVITIVIFFQKVDDLVERYKRLKKVLEVKSNLALNETQAVLFSRQPESTNCTIVDPPSSTNCTLTESASINDDENKDDTFCVSNKDVTGNNNNSTFNVNKTTKRKKDSALVDDKENTGDGNVREEEEHDNTYTLETDENESVIQNTSITANRAKRTKRDSSANDNLEKNKRKGRSKAYGERLIDGNGDAPESETLGVENSNKRGMKGSRGKSVAHHSMVMPGELSKKEVGTPLRPRRNPARRKSTNN